MTQEDPRPRYIKRALEALRTATKLNRKLLPDIVADPDFGVLGLSQNGEEELAELLKS